MNKYLKELMREYFRFQPGDVILIKADTKFLWTNPILSPFFRGYKHAMFYYGENERGTPLGMESCAKGALISTLYKQVGWEIEVYRINHPYSKIFGEAIVMAGEKLVDREITFYDYFLIAFKVILSKLGILFRFKFLKRYPCRVCSEFCQVCIENAVEFLAEPFRTIYKKEVLSHFPPAKLMLPADFKEIPILEKIWEGKVERLVKTKN